VPAQLVDPCEVAGALPRSRLTGESASRHRFGSYYGHPRARKCLLIAAALTLIQRSLLPERPGFFVTAGQRGGGKTTTLIMLLMAITGLRPSAAAWSPHDEERRKALLSYLMEGVPAIVWDNIPRGARISCPHIERACTIEDYSDRRLGVNEVITVPRIHRQFLYRQ
jgi:hypothetical protein